MNIINAKKNILKVANLKNKGHVPSALSILDIVYNFYDLDLNKYNDFILSKGHACLALYSVLLEKKLLTEEEYFSFSDFDSKLGGHPHRLKHNEILASTGSLGHGLSFSVGKAMGYKLQKKDNKVFCLVGDGECNEGSIWEAAILASNLNLNNLVCLVDFNDSQIRSQRLLNIDEKFKAFNWEVLKCSGHDHHAISSCFSSIINNKNNKMPICIVFDTIKGYGIKEMEEDFFSWHHRGINETELNNFLNQIQ
jgi:transketolase